MRVQSHSIEVHSSPRSISYLGKVDPGFMRCQLWGEYAKLSGPLAPPPPYHNSLPRNLENTWCLIWFSTLPHNWYRKWLEQDWLWWAVKNAIITVSISGGSKITQLCFQQRADLKMINIQQWRNDWESDEPPRVALFSPSAFHLPQPSICLKGGAPPRSPHMLPTFCVKNTAPAPTLCFPHCSHEVCC